MKKADNENFINFITSKTRLTEEDIDILLAGTRLLVFRRGETVYKTGDDPMGVIIVKQGSLSTFASSEQGRLICISRAVIEQSTFFATAECAERLSEPINIIAEENAKIYVIPPATLKRITQQNAQFTAFLFNEIAKQLSFIVSKCQTLAFMDVGQRLVTFLLDEYNLTGRTEIKTTHEAIATHIGTSREVVSRMLLKIAHLDIIATHRGVVTILDVGRLEKLKSLSGGAL